MRKIIFTICLLAAALPNLALAQQPVAKQNLEVEGLSIDPFIIEVNADAGETITKQIQLTNTTNDPLTFVASINDFVPNGTTGQPLFLANDKDADPKYSLSKWVTITKQPQFTIPPHGNTSVEFTINVPASVEPGTHYGGILFGRPVTGLESSGSAVQHKAGAIVLVKLGSSAEQIDLAQFSTNKKIYTQGPVDFTTLLENYGNVHSKPKGEITIKNFWGRQIIQVPINRDANIILPNSKREFISTWNPKLAFGRYTASALIYYGNPKLEIQAHLVIWVLPAKQIILSVIIFLILGIIIYAGIRRYNRYIIKRYGNEI